MGRSPISPVAVPITLVTLFSCDSVDCRRARSLLTARLFAGNSNGSQRLRQRVETQTCSINSRIFGQFGTPAALDPKASYWLDGERLYAFDRNSTTLVLAPVPEPRDTDALDDVVRHNKAHGVSILLHPDTISVIHSDGEFES